MFFYIHASIHYSFLALFLHDLSGIYVVKVFSKLILEQIDHLYCLVPVAQMS